MCVIWLSGDYSRLEHDVRAREESMLKEQGLSESRSLAFRTFMRYVFHELRVPLNAIMLGVTECSEEVLDLRDAVESVKAGLKVSGGEPLPQALAALADAIGLVESRLGASRETTLPQAMAALNLAAESTARLRTRFPLPQALAELASATASAHSVIAMLDTVSSNATAMNKLLDDFLSLEKIDAGRMTLEDVEVDVASFVRETASLFKALLAAKEIDLAVGICASVPASFFGDVNKLRQVLSNLVSNAVKFVRSGGSIVIQVTSQQQLESGASTGANSLGLSSALSESEGEEETKAANGNGDAGTPTHKYLRFAVFDDGPGISKDDQAKLFLPFAQIRAGALQKGNGTGLGLSICKRIVELAHGRVGVHSQEGVGSNFFFIVPAGSPQSLVEATQSAHVEAPIPHGPLSVQLLSCVVVDDVESNRVLFGRMLSRRGVKSILYACDGAEMLRLVEPPDACAAIQCVFLDKEMPVMDGHECAGRLRSMGLTRLPIIGVTGNALQCDCEAFVDAGADVVIFKPVKVDALERALASVGLHLESVRSVRAGASAVPA